jgi:17beta-estradiol 17-dehydrogenase / very-long-chain 3-oxoacyl-CoA reductase
MNITSSKLVRYVIYFIVILFVYQALLLLLATNRFVHKHFICNGVNLPKRYGKDSYVLITGASSGQGKYFAKEFARNGFNLILVGSERTEGTIKEINSEIEKRTQDKNQPKIKIIFIKKDFRKAHQPIFFSEIESALQTIDGNICGLINNVAYRTAWNPYHNMPEHLINDTIVVGTIVQSQLTRICMPYFLERRDKSFIINITAQCIFPTFGFGEVMDNNITVPFLSVYEGANAFGFYQGNSIYKEYKKFTDKIDIMNVMPGAVVTENTEYLSNTIFNVDAESFVKNIINQLGIYDGNIYGHWGHEISILLVNMFPFIKNKILYNVGYNISQDFMNKPPKKY